MKKRLSFQDIFNAVKPEVDISEFLPVEVKAAHTYANKKGVRFVDKLISIMAMHPDDWTETEKKEIAKELWGKAVNHA